MSQKKLYIFNPEHDLALANGNAHFNAPITSKDFSQDAAWLSAWMTKEGYVLNHRPISEEDQDFYKQIGLQAISIKKEEVQQVQWSSVVPWGWDAAVCEGLRKLGVNQSLLPDNESLQSIRTLSHRSFAINALHHILAHSKTTSNFPKPAMVLKNIAEIERFLSENHSIILKSPWSGSGKGLRWCCEKLSKSDEGWCRNILKKQGVVIGEKRYELVQDFAMEFYCDKEVAFSGYSVFKTENGIYRGNMLASDALLSQMLQKWVSEYQLLEIKQLLVNYLSLHVLGKYHGYLGVDMFIYQENGVFKIHPAVEINLRTTMGLMARKIHDFYLSKKSIGWMQMDYSSQPNQLLEMYQQKKQHHPLHIVQQRIQEGCLALCPISKNTKYSLTITIQKQ